MKSIAVYIALVLGLALAVVGLAIDAADGYRVVFSLPELDSGTGSTEALLAFELEGKPLSGELGTFRLVVPTDKRGARWARQVTKISLVDLSKP